MGKPTSSKRLLHLALDERQRATLEAIKENEGISLAAAARRCIDQVANGVSLTIAAIPASPKRRRARINYVNAFRVIARSPQ